MSKSSSEWINTQGDLIVQVPKAEYEALKARVALLEERLESRPVSLERLRAAVEKLRHDFPGTQRS